MWVVSRTRKLISRCRIAIAVRERLLTMLSCSNGSRSRLYIPAAGLSISLPLWRERPRPHGNADQRTPSFPPFTRINDTGTRNRTGIRLRKERKRTEANAGTGEAQIDEVVRTAHRATDFCPRAIRSAS